MADSHEVLRARIDALRDLISVQFAEREKLHDSGHQALIKQIDTIVDANNASAKALEMRLDRITDRVTVIESKQTGHSEVWGYVVAFVGLVFSGMVAFGIYATR